MRTRDIPADIAKEPPEQPPSSTTGKTKRLKGLGTRSWNPSKGPSFVTVRCYRCCAYRWRTLIVLPLLVVDVVVLVAVVFQPRLVVAAYAALMSLRLFLSVPRDDHACISQGYECVAASSSSEVWSFGLARNQERAPSLPAAADHYKPEFME
ncbi:unnamed protein product [Lactuca saligna]|uniref:Uncharacterized protein n=1 Tax=Lactuca saligna TaxID=75948 RepID=A0AA35ZNV6_LACSI|nr:unnamed protein product [Lactuca saligna]